MKIILTGEPKSGKSTLLNSLLSYMDKPWGFVTKELIDNNERYGFEIITHQNKRAGLASTKIKSEFNVGKYNVDLIGLDKIINSMPEYEYDDFIYIDEIGEMQLKSYLFKDLIYKILESKNNFVGTMSYIYEDELIKQIKNNDDLLIFKLKPSNREAALKALIAILKYEKKVIQLTPNQQTKIYELLKNNVKKENYVSIYKLFNNAIFYVMDNRIKEKANHFEVLGNTNKHIVLKKTMECDCPLFQGRKPFIKSEPCSHIQAIQILKQ